MYTFDEIAEQVFFPIYNIIADDIIQELSPKTLQGKFLDVGCGGGHLGMSLLDKTDVQMDFIDINQSAVAKAKSRAEERKLAKRCQWWVGDVHHLPMKDQSYDGIVSRSSFGFWKDQRQAFSELVRILKPGATAYVGGGLGNNETKKIIKQKMRTIDPTWPESLQPKFHSLTNAAYLELFQEMGVVGRVFDDDEKGRWLIFTKPSVVVAE